MVLAAVATITGTLIIMRGWAWAMALDGKLKLNLISFGRRCLSGAPSQIHLDVPFANFDSLRIGSWKVKFLSDISSYSSRV